jgi:NAD(P)-dependent dehydrogenase (short-subunit alcohol dehydrogenase family)
MTGRRALVTGAASGIGRSIARSFARAGASLILVDIDREGLVTVKDELCGEGVDVVIQPADLTDPEALRNLWQGVATLAPDVLINNAGSYPMCDFLDLDADAVRQTLDLNLISVLWMCQHFISLRRRLGGTIVNVSSVEALAPFRDDLIPYGVAKAGVLALTRSLAHAYGRSGFRVNVVVPGAIRTPGTERLRRKAIRTLSIDLLRTGYHFGTRLSLGRWGSADEVAAVVLFLASDLASYVQGAAIPVDGGFLAS